MATQVRTQEHGITLYQAVQRWEYRLRWQRLVARLPVSIALGLLAGVALGILARLRPLLLPDQLLIVTAAAVTVSLVVLFLVTFLSPRTRLESARHFDVRFGLQERVSTALELLEGRIQSQADLFDHQLSDAVARAQDVPVEAELPLRQNWRAWTAGAVLLIVFVLLLVLPNPQVTAISDITARQAALDEAVEDIKGITEQIAADTNLTDEERAELLQALQSSQEALSRPDVTLEEAFASLSEVEAQLQDQSDLFDQRLNAERQALEDAADTLRNLVPPDALPQQEQQSIAEILDSMAQNADSMTSEEQQQAADGLQDAANQLSGTNPEAAQQLEQASQNMRQGNTQQAQQNLQQAQQQLQQDQQQAQQQGQLSQQLQEGSQQLQERAQQLSQQGQPQQGGQPQNNQDQQGNPQDSQNPPGQPQQPGQGGASNSEENQNQDGKAGESQNNPSEGEIEPGGAPQSGEGEAQQAQQAGGEQGENPGDAMDGAGAAAGDSPGAAGSEDENAGQPGAIEGDNNPDGQGEGIFESIFAPRRIGGQGDQQIVLEPDAGDTPAIEGEFAENLPGEVTVPYNQVFSDYSNAANRALESDYIPLGLRDVVRDYFSSLEPGR